jgi:hypothetical protein
LSEEKFLDFNFALEISKIEKADGDVVRLYIYFEVKEGIFVVNLDDSMVNFSRFYFYGLFNAQKIKRINLTLGMADY